MKKYVSSLIVSVLILVFSSVVFSDVNYVPHIIVGGLIKVSGGNRNTKLAEYEGFDNIEYLEGEKYRYTETEGFDVKESLRQLYDEGTVTSSQYKRSSGIENKSDEVKNHLISIFGTQVLNPSAPEADTLKALLPYKEFNERTWADIKYRELDDEEQGRKIVILPSGRTVKKPVSKNTIPTVKNGLLNPKAPITAVTFTNKITLNLPPYILYEYSARLLDSKGREIGSLKDSGRNDDSREIRSEIPLSWEAGNYYLEFRYNIGSPKYCYILLNIEPDRTAPAEDKTVSGNINRMVEAGAKGEKVAEDYMKKNNITDKAQLTEENKQAIAEEYVRTQTTSAQRTHALSQMEIISNYMKEHNIRSMAGLTDKDSKEISKLVMENAILSWPPEQREVADSYMKQHNISSYRDITEKDMTAIGKLLKQQISQQKKAASKKSNRK